MPTNSMYNVITFFVYADGITRHTYFGIGGIKYDIIASYPKSMLKKDGDIMNLINKYKVLFKGVGENIVTIIMADQLTLRTSGFRPEYGLNDE